jgi:shikimate dehydrogenase
MCTLGSLPWVPIITHARGGGGVGGSKADNRYSVASLSLIPIAGLQMSKSLPSRRWISGHTRVIAHVGYPTHAFKSPLIYNPYFERHGIDVVVVPMAVTDENYASVFRSLWQIENLAGVLITMPHKVTSISLVDVLTPAAMVAGACNAARWRDGQIEGAMFDGAGFVDAVSASGRQIAGASALVVGSGGVGSAIAASLAEAGIGTLALSDTCADSAAGLAARIRTHFPDCDAVVDVADPAGYQFVVNATPMGMEADDPLPFDPDRLDADTFVGEVVMATHHTPILKAALAKGCEVQVGVDMLFAQIPAYLEFFGLPVASSAALRDVAQLGETS